MIKIAKVTSVMDTDELDMPFCYVKYLGKQQRANLFTPYGLIHHPPINSLSLLLSVQGQESKCISISNDPNTRTLRALKEGEVAISNYMTGDYIYFDENGNFKGVVTKDMEFEVGEDINLTVGENIDITVGNNITVKADQKIKFEAPEIEFVSSGANLSLGSNAGFTSGAFTHNGKNIGSTHKHIEVSTGTGVSGVPQ